MAQDTMPIIRSCSRMAGQERAQCEWENHKAYRELATQGVLQQGEEEMITDVPAVQLPSCARLQGQEKATCLWQNQKTMRAMLIGGDDSGDSSSAASSSAQGRIMKGRTRGVPGACRSLQGRERATCIREARRAGRKG